MPRTFLAPPIERLTGEGRFEPADAGGAPWRRPLVLIARELCSFEWFGAPGGGRAPSAQAARLYARANAPFLRAGVSIRRAGAGHGVWWWDLDRIEPWLSAEFGAAAIVAAPETLAQPPGSGWRIVRLASGFELQCWRGRALVASSWRATAPDAREWAAFVRQVRDPATPPPDLPPPPQTLPIASDARIGADAAMELTPASAASLAAGVCAVAMAGASAFWFGQGLRLSALSAPIERQAEITRSAASPQPADTAAEQRIAAFRTLSDRPDAVAGLAAALSVLKANGVTAQSFAVDGPVLTVKAPYATLARADAISAALEDTGAFSSVRPLPDSAAGSIKFALTMKGAAAGSNAGPLASPAG
jgi:hypothetical protein